MGGLADRIRYALADPLCDDQAVDPMRELAELLREAGLEVGAGGGAVTFAGRDPIVSSPLPFATMAAVALMAKAVSVAALWRFRGGQGQDLSVNLGKALHRLCPFYDKKWELLNGYAPGNPADRKNPFMPTNMYRTRDDRRILFMNIYPHIRSAALAFLGCNDDATAIGRVIRQWDAFDLEEQANRAGLQATVVRSAQEFLNSEQCRYLEDLPLVHIEKIADSDPEPFTPRPKTPLGGVRALGFSHVIAGPGMGRALAYHGADVLNLWTPNDFEMDFNYYSANLGIRSAILDFGRSDEMARFRRLVAGADIFFANRRPGLLEKLGITSSELSRLRPGIVQVDFSIYGAVGPWANWIGSDHTAGGVCGVLALEGSVEEPKLPEIFVVNDYVSSWIGMVGAIAVLRRRATEGGSYRVRVSLARVSLWLLQMGIFDKAYASDVAGRAGDHAYPTPRCSRPKRPVVIIRASPTRSSCRARRVFLPCPWFHAAPAGRSGWPADFARMRSITGVEWKEKTVTGRLAGKRAIVTDPTEYNGADIVALFREEGAEVFAESWDMTRPEAADEIVREAGHVDILIANLAYPHTYAPAHEKTDADLEYAMRRIMYPLHRLTRAVLPQMLERQRGKIVVVGSATSLRGRKGGVAVYGAARGAQHGYMKNVAMEVAPYVNINATAQTYVDNITYWPMEYRETAEFRERMAENPAARLATGRECAQTVLFLAGPESDFFYGQIIPFAGGWTV